MSLQRQDDNNSLQLRIEDDGAGIQKTQPAPLRYGNYGRTRPRPAGGIPQYLCRVLVVALAYNSISPPKQGLPMPLETPQSLLIVDDHPCFCKGVRYLVNMVP